MVPVFLLCYINEIALHFQNSNGYQNSVTLLEFHYVSRIPLHLGNGISLHYKIVTSHYQKLPEFHCIMLQEFCYTYIIGIPLSF